MEKADRGVNGEREKRRKRDGEMER